MLHHHSGDETSGYRVKQSIHRKYPVTRCMLGSGETLSVGHITGGGSQTGQGLDTRHPAEGQQTLLKGKGDQIRTLHGQNYLGGDVKASVLLCMGYPTGRQRGRTWEVWLLNKLIQEAQGVLWIYKDISHHGGPLYVDQSKSRSGGTSQGHKIQDLAEA